MPGAGAGLSTAAGSLVPRARLKAVSPDPSLPESEPMTPNRPRGPLILLVLLALCRALPAAAAAPAPAAEVAPAAPTIGLDEIHQGLRGYGVTVFAGDHPERFDAEVVGVIHNAAPGTSYILARLTGHGLEDSGVAAGMSGSPVYFDGRLAGAVAFAWPFSREAIAGVTPIADMHALEGGASGLDGARPAAGGGPPVSLSDLVAGHVPDDLLERRLARWTPQLDAGARSGLEWSAAGFGESSRSLLGRALGTVAPLGEVPRAAAAGAATPAAQPLEPGAAVAAVLVDGDLRLAATGTVTDRIGDRVYAFGHPFLGLGPVAIPMASAQVVTVLASEYSSFKISNLGPVVGAFDQDRRAGIVGRMGETAATIPLVVRIGGAQPREYHMRLAQVPEITPALLGIATLGGLDAASFAGGRQGLDLTASFALGERGGLDVVQSFDGEGAASDAANYLTAVAGYLMRNDLADVAVDGIEVELGQTVRPRTATLVGAHADRTVVRPGERVALNLDLTAWRGDGFRRRVEVQVPQDAPRGSYYLFVGDGSSVDAARLLVEKTSPVTFRQALDLLRSLHSRRDLVVMGLAAGPGLSVAGEVMPNLPGSVRSIWSAAPSGSATPLRLAVVQQQAEGMDVPVDGLVRIDLEVDRREPLHADAGADGASPGADGTSPGAAAEPAPARPAAGDGAGEDGDSGAREPAAPAAPGS